MMRLLLLCLAVTTAAYDLEDIPPVTPALERRQDSSQAITLVELGDILPTECNTTCSAVRPQLNACAQQAWNWDACNELCATDAFQRVGRCLDCLIGSQDGRMSPAFAEGALGRIQRMCDNWGLKAEGYQITMTGVTPVPTPTPSATAAASASTSKDDSRLAGSFAGTNAMASAVASKASSGERRLRELVGPLPLASLILGSGMASGLAMWFV